MLIRSLTLNNIRSYEDSTIVFPEGKILLSGDIGSGKTTILLAIEFALFGLLRGTTAGAGLLRHGAGEGSVELTMQLGLDEITIRRTLTRGKQVKQDAGFIRINGKEEAGTPVELKSRILSLIGYPDEMLSKSKSLIYRYTVYTPQEEMKQILNEGAEERLTTIRQVFDLDKYQRVKENTVIVLRELKHDRDILLERLRDEQQFAKEKEDKAAALEEAQKKVSAVRRELLAARSVVDEKAAALQELEDRARAAQKVQRDLAANGARIAGIEELQVRLKGEVQELASRIAQDALPEIPDASVLRELISGQEEKIKAVLAEVSCLQEGTGVVTARMRHAHDLMAHIGKIDTCPTCLQVVSEEHKRSIMRKEEQAIQIARGEHTAILKSMADRQAELAAFRSGLKALEVQEKEIRFLEHRKKLHQDMVERKRVQEEQISILEKESGNLKRQRASLDEKSGESAGIERQYAEMRTALDKARDAFHAVQIEETRLKTTIMHFEERLEDLKNLLATIAEMKKKAQRTTDVITWLDTHFFELVDRMERHLLATIHREFEEHFISWFGVLIDDASLAVRLSEDFSPAIEQDGYETAVDNLSGGEKTAVALAYRLALFAAINDFVTGIKTKDLIILDEPTDGFSAEQLDRVRDVLDELATRQTIIVSHEQKMEGFVDHIIRVVKENHASQVLVEA